MHFRAYETDLIHVCSLEVIFEEKLIKHVKMDGRLMQHSCQMSLASFLETIIDIFNYSYYALLRPKPHLSRHL